MDFPPADQIPPESGQPTIARSASILFVGNMASRILGLVREMVIAYFFGASGQVSAFRIASQVPTLLYDFLVGGMLSAALVPVLSDYLRTRSRKEFARLVSTILGVFAIILALVVILLELTAPFVAQLLAGGFDKFDPTLLPLTVTLIRLMSPAVWLFSMAGVVTAILYAQERFVFPAIATAVYNLGIVIAAPLLSDQIGIISLAVGILLGSTVQLALMWWDLVRSGVRVQLSINWHHPALRKILVLYAPIAAGLVVSLFQVGLDRRLASGTGAESIAWMANATTLQQMPLGLISVAISLAALPRLSQYYALGDEVSYRRTLGRGLRMVLLLIVPAAVGLWFLGTPVTRVLFQRGDFTAMDTAQVSSALSIYLLGMLFAAIDFPLNYAFYARNNTLLPALVGVGSVLVYMIVAFTLVEPLGYLGLVWADTAKQASHALVMVVMLRWRVGPLDSGLARGVGKIAAAALGMAAAIVVLQRLFGYGLSSSLLANIAYIVIVGGIGSAFYVAALYALGLPELRDLLARIAARRRLKKTS
jgi:putative peptidoglycan lipid II flippase